MVCSPVSNFTERRKNTSFFETHFTISSLSMTYLGVIEAYKIEKSSADKSPFYWQRIKFFLKLAQSLMFSFSLSSCPPPPCSQLVFSHIYLSFLSLKILGRFLGLDFNISNLINFLNFHKP